MAIELAAASIQHYESATFTSTYPITLVTWFKPANASTDHTLVGLFDDGTLTADALYLQARGTVGGDPVSAVAAAASLFSVATAGAFIQGRWQHGAAVFSSTSSRTAYLNGVGGTPETTLRASSGILRTLIGRFKSNASDVGTDCALAHVGIYTSELTAGQLLQLAQGARCDDIAADNLLAYWKFERRGLLLNSAIFQTARPLYPGNGGGRWVDDPPVRRSDLRRRSIWVGVAATRPPAVIQTQTQAVHRAATY